VDYDDAIFHRYGLHANGVVRRLLRTKIASIMRGATTVVAGNAYLADVAVASGASAVEIIPTVVDLRKYPVQPERESDEFVIGWIGSPSTVQYLSEIAAPLADVCRLGKTRFITVGGRPAPMTDVPLEVREWSEEGEFADMMEFNAGVMPLPDSPWERGKCGHKLVKYMACGRAVVASPVGVNVEMVEPGVNGFLASGDRAWSDALRALRADPRARAAMGAAGRRLVEDHYSLAVTAPRLARILEQAAGATH
jgi:glycosyltransferase involved in cell wall biosynthesis